MKQLTDERVLQTDGTTSFEEIYNFVMSSNAIEMKVKPSKGAVAPSFTIETEYCTMRHIIGDVLVIDAQGELRTFTEIEYEDAKKEIAEAKKVKVLEFSRHTTMWDVHVFALESKVESYKIHFDGENQVYVALETDTSLVRCESSGFLVKDRLGNVTAYTQSDFEEMYPKVANEVRVAVRNDHTGEVLFQELK